MTLVFSATQRKQTILRHESDRQNSHHKAQASRAHSLRKEDLRVSQISLLDLPGSIL